MKQIRQEMVKFNPGGSQGSALSNFEQKLYL